MKAEATAENRPACTGINAVADVNRQRSTHEDQGGVQVLIVLLHKVAVVLIGFALEFVVEFAAGAA
jgi:hypothetical protein